VLWGAGPICTGLPTRAQVQSSALLGPIVKVAKRHRPPEAERDQHRLGGQDGCSRSAFRFALLSDDGETAKECLVIFVCDDRAASSLLRDQSLFLDRLEEIGAAQGPAFANSSIPYASFISMTVSSHTHGLH
jgi:hypothetical protein